MQTAALCKLGLLASVAAVSTTAAVYAEGKRATQSRVAEFSAGGLLFRDNVHVEAFEDPKVAGITIFISAIDRPIIDRLRKDFWTDPSQSSVACAQTGVVRLLEPIAEGPAGEEVFSSKRSLIFKNQHVRRVYDAEHQTLLYISYSTRLTQDMQEQNARYRTSVTAISLAQQDIKLSPS